MKRVFENMNLNYTIPGKYTLTVSGEGVKYESANGKKNLSLKFSEIGTIFIIGYCSSNQSYNVTFFNNEGKEIGDFNTDTRARSGHNVLETKTILIANAESKLTKAFPDNLEHLDLKIAIGFGGKAIRIKDGALVDTKKQIKLSDIRRAKCITNGTLSNLFVYTKDKGGFFDLPDMKVPVNELSLPIFEAVMARNVGRGIDFSRGNGWDQETCEYVLIRYMNASFFANEDGSVTDDWHRIAYEHVQSYHSDICAPEDMEGAMG